MNEIKTEIREKENRIRRFLKESCQDGLLISRQDNFAWITAGGDSHVGIATEAGAASCLVTAGKKFLIAANIEIERISREEVAGQGFTIHSYPWHRDEKLALIRRLAGSGRLISDDGFGGLPNAAAEIPSLRYSLLEGEIKRYRLLGKSAGEIVGKVSRAVRPGDTEHQVAARLAQKLLSEGIMPVVILVAADERINRYRHPIPTEKKIKKRVMVVVCARRQGLIASLTRLVHFGKINRELRDKHRSVTAVDAAFISATRPGALVGEIFKTGLRAYREGGFADEWRLHHQGGATGYASRDYKATLEDKRQVALNQAFAWNPSISGTKSEDTVIALERQTEIITPTSSWPMIPVICGGRVISRPDILEL